MDGYIEQEALLRHLLTTHNCATNDEFVYSVLLGFRLFLSPRQLLSELRRISNEEVARESLLLPAGKTCPKCGHVQKKTVEKNALREFKTNGRGDQKRISNSHAQDDSSCSVYIDSDGTLRRKKRGRARCPNELYFLANSHANSENRMCCSSDGSRDSGILSAFMDIDDIDNAKNRKKTTARSPNNNSLIGDNYKSPCTNCSIFRRNVRSLARKHQLVHVLYEWVRHFPADFRNKKIIWTLHDVIKTCQKENEELKTNCTEVLDSISRLTAAQETYEQLLTDMEHVVFLKRSNQFRKTTDYMVHFILDMKEPVKVNEMAQQLCLIETEFLRHVGAEEFLQLFSADGDEDSKTNLGACVSWFNRLSHLVGTIICLCRKHKQAKQVLVFFAKVANCCFDLSNFNSSMAILTGLSLGPVTRLKKVWDKLDLPELTKLQKVFDPSNNFLKYRSIYLSRADKLQTSPIPNKRLARDFRSSLQSITSQQDISELDDNHSVVCRLSLPKFQDSMKHFDFDPSRVSQGSIMVPFLVLLVKDVYFLNQSMETLDENGKVNFEKLHTLGNILRPLEEYKQMISTFQKQDDMQNFLLRAPIQDDDGLYLLSYKREPPTNRFEKQQLKSLKGEISSRRRRCQAMTI